jgi:Ca2+-binding RTX toxin-like protein
MMFGGGGDDYMEGNAASDTMTGQAGNDDMVGGTGRINDDPAAGSDGRRDAADTIHGDAGFDVISGDNAVINRVLSGGQWQPNGFNGGIQHERRILRDIDSAVAVLVSGGDSLYGDADDDLIYGQGGGDEIFGGAGDDAIEGNAAADTIRGESGQDDIVGGTTEAALGDAGDWIDGGDEADVILGDNGTIERPLTGNRQWLRDTFASDAQNIVQRSIVLFDNTTTLGGSQPAPTVSGGDALFGGNGRDRMFGQNNGAQPASQLDAPDGADNDLDGATDEDVPWLGDEMYGGAGDDYMEGNAGNDWMSGDAGQDDLIGGYSVRNGVIDSNAEPTNMVDGSDILRGNAGDDVLLGDNASIVRPLDGSGLWRRIVGGAAGFDLVVRETSMPTNPQQQGIFGNDFMLGNDGHDDMYGQGGDDYMEGNAGQDALVGDLGKITNRLEDGSRQRVIATKQPFLEETIFAAGSLSRLVELYAHTDPNSVAGTDIMLGGDNRDALHGGPGDDLINGDGDSDIAGTTDQDQVFGGDGDDALWGGRSSDHVWGGHGADNLDVKPRSGDPATWHTYAGTDNYQDMDILYGGWDQDALQANIGGPGPQPGDRLLDWAGAFNVYYTCPGAYGEGVITRSIAPSVIKFLQDLAEGDGADRPSLPPGSGYQEIGIVFNRDIRFNSNPPHPDHPGHFTCN